MLFSFLFLSSLLRSRSLALSLSLPRPPSLSSVQSDRPPSLSSGQSDAVYPIHVFRSQSTSGSSVSSCCSHSPRKIRITSTSFWTVTVTPPLYRDSPALPLLHRVRYLMDHRDEQTGVRGGSESDGWAPYHAAGRRCMHAGANAWQREPASMTRSFVAQRVTTRTWGRLGGGLMLIGALPAALC